MDRKILVVILFIIFLPFLAVEANNDPFEKLNDTFYVNYLDNYSLNIKWDTTCGVNENLYYKTIGKSESKTVANCYEKPFSTERECQAVLNSLESNVNYNFAIQCGDASYQYLDYFTVLEKINDNLIDISNITATSVTISWPTSRSSASKIFYYPENNEFDQNTIIKSTKTTIHRITINDLKPETRYKFKVTSSSQDGGVISNYLYFSTLAEIKKPDLIIHSANYKVEDLTIGEMKYDAITFDVILKNIGGSDANDYTISMTTPKTDEYYEGFLFSGQYSYFSSSNSMKAGQEKKILMGSYLLPKGKSLNTTFDFKIDSENKVNESGEDNNTIKRFVKINGSSDTQNINQISEINNNAKILAEGNIDKLLAEIKQLRNEIREQNAKIKYLEKLLKNVEKLSENMENALNNFITYGADDNTQKLGEGERAAVIYSYKSAFKKLPENEEELADVIRIANGRWPNSTNVDAEKKAKKQFKKIYKRIADMSDPKDNAAITVMAYGLRQKAENRNVNSEKNGIKAFKNIYGYTPESTEDWNIMQAITYSGTARGVDTDGDLLTDDRENKLGSDPGKKDSDGDGFIDGIEVENGYSPTKK